MARMQKPLTWVGSSLDDLRRFPKAVRATFGIELMAVQLGKAPTDFKPMATIGSGAYEIRVRLDGAWRVVYVAKKAGAVFVLHAFKKTTQKTSKADIDIAKARYKLIKGEQ